MRAGHLRHMVVLEAPSEARDSLGQAVATWTPFATVWGSVEPLSGRETFLAAQVQAEVTARARLRYIEGVTPKMRLRHDSTIYSIVAVIDRELRHRELELLLVEGLKDS